jgi:hypothetical protein
MAIDIFLFLTGLILAGLTLRDVFDTVVVPGGSQAFLKVARRLVFALLPLWKHARGRRRGLSRTFAPLILVLSFVIWMSLLGVSFGLMAYAARFHFQPPLESLGEGIYVVGTSLVTVGLSQVNPTGGARWIVLAAGFCGLAVMTMAVTYLLEVQNSIARRDTGMIKLTTSAGDPPCALSLLERFAALGDRRELADVLQEGRNWCATVRQSHASHPSLISFQSVSTRAGWPAALGALLDLALIVELCIDDERLYGPAVLLGEEGMRMARELALVIGLPPRPVSPDERLFRDVAKRLADAGYAVRRQPDFGAMARRRADYASCVDALADHLGEPSAVLLRA